MIIRNGLQVYRPILYFVLCALFFLTLSRAVLLVWQWSRVSAVEGAGYVLLHGLRFDFILVCSIVLLPALMAPFFGHKIFWTRVQVGFLSIAFLLIVFMEAATPTFISEYDLRPNILFVEYLKYPQEVGLMLLGGYKLDIFIGLCLVAICSMLFMKHLKRFSGIARRPTLRAAFLGGFVVVLVCFLGIRSSLGHRPANPASVAFSTDLLVNDLTISSLYSTAYAIYSSARHEKSSQSYGRMTLPNVIGEVRKSMVVDEDRFIAGKFPTLHLPKQTSSVEGPVNLVIILEESMGAEFVGSLGGVNVTPELDMLSEEGIWFDNLYATGTRSVRGIEAIVSGFTPTPARSVVKLPKSQTDFFTVAQLLSRRGYETSFIYGGEAHFDNMRQFFVGNGFTKIIEEKDFLEPLFKGSWGVSDEDLLQRAHKEFSEAGEKPFFSLVFTSSNHSPFEYPDGRIVLHDSAKATVNNAVKYADHALGEFFRLAKNSNYWNNTLFLVVADHNSRVRGANLVPIEFFHIPALILGGGVTPSINSRLASQIDLLPTLLGMMSIDDAVPATGYDLFRPDIDSIPGRAIMQYNSTQAYMQGEKVVVMEMGKKPALYINGTKGLVPASVQDEALIKRALANSIWSSHAYQERLYQIL